MHDHELAIQSILDELTFLECHMSSGQRFSADELNDLSESLIRLADIITKAGQLEQITWETDNKPLLLWLQRRQDDEEEIEEHVAQKVG
jgi:hypothetical protein